MSTSFNTRTGNGRYYLEFETDNYEHYKYMQQSARNCIDGKQDAESEKAEKISLWIVNKEGYYLCLRCEEYALLDWAGSSIPSDFCPHCGSKMKKVHKVKISGARWKK